MTVEQLIEILKTKNPKAEVKVSTIDFYGYEIYEEVDDAISVKESIIIIPK